MIPLYERIVQLCSINNITIKLLESEAGLTSNSIGKWGKSIPSGDRILKVAQYFDVSVDYLLGNTENPKSHKNEPHYDVVGTIAGFQELKREIEATSESFVKSLQSLSALADDKIKNVKRIGGESISNTESSPEDNT